MSDKDMFELRGNDIWSIETGTLVARLDGGGHPVMERGKKSLERQVRAWLASNPDDAQAQAVEEPVTAEAQAVEEPVTAEAQVVEEPVAPFWPDQEGHVKDAAELGLELPPLCPRLDPVLGVETPGFREYCKAAHLSEEETVALIHELQ